MSNGQTGSGIGEDRLSADLVETVDSASADQSPVIHDPVLGVAGSDGSTGVVDSLPIDLEVGSVDGSVALEDGSGDDPIDVNVAGGVARGDLDTSRVFDSSRVDAVDHVTAQDSGALLEFRDGETPSDGEPTSSDDEETLHVSESMGGLGRTWKAVLAISALFVVAVMAFAIFEPVQVLPRIRVAPGFAMIDQSGTAFTSEDGAGLVTLYNFAPTSCGDSCEPMHDTMREVASRVATEVDMGEAEFRLVTVALDTNDPEVLAGAASEAGADGEVWRWVGADHAVLDEVVRKGFRVYFDAPPGEPVVFDTSYAIVDGAGLVRGEYSYATISSDADRLTRHIGILGEEIRNAGGNNALLYEAAHVFLCYP